MKIRNDFATLRTQYSGFWQWLHLAAIAVWLAPYAYFIARLWFRRWNADLDSVPSITVIEALARYTWNGGEDWQSGYAYSRIFILSVWGFLYNVVRFALLIRTKTLELSQEANGVYPDFRLTGIWSVLHPIAFWGLFVNLGAVLWHTFHFLAHRIPLTL